MLDTRIILSGLWVATMLTFLWGDVLGSISGYTEPGKIGESVYVATHVIWVGIAALMLSPIVMIVLNLTLDSLRPSPSFVDRELSNIDAVDDTVAQRPLG